MGNHGGKEDLKEADALEKSRRVDKCLVSFRQLLLDAKYLNTTCSKYFVDPVSGTILQFQVFTKLTNPSIGMMRDCVPVVWKLRDNVVVQVWQQLPLAAMIATPSVPSVTTPIVATTASHPLPSTTGRPASGSSSSSSAPTAAAPTERKRGASTSATPPTGVDTRLLTLREFYAVFVWMMDNVGHLHGGEEGATSIGDRPRPVAQGTGDKQCSICLEENVEVLTACLHAFCTACISDWNIKSKTCPICRGDSDVATDDYWVMSDAKSADVGEMVEKVKKYPHLYVHSKPHWTAPLSAVPASAPLSLSMSSTPLAVTSVVAGLPVAAPVVPAKSSAAVASH